MREDRLPGTQGDPIGVPTVQGDKLPEFTASDVLSTKLWQPRADRPPLGIDLACTKVAVDFQNISAGNADAVIRQSLEILREAINTDAVFLVLLDGHGERRINGIANHDLGEFGKQLNAKGFKTNSINLAMAPEVPANANVLLIANPQVDLQPPEVQKVRQFVQGGGDHAFQGFEAQIPAILRFAAQDG